MTCLSRKGKKRRKRVKLVDGRNPYGRLVNGKHNPRLSEIPGKSLYPFAQDNIKSFIRKIVLERTVVKEKPVRRPYGRYRR